MEIGKATVEDKSKQSKIGLNVNIRKTVVKHKSILGKIGIVVVIAIAYFIMLQQPIVGNPKLIDQWIGFAGNTVLISVLAIMMGFGIGVVVGLGRISRNFIINGVATVYVEVLRGTPLLIQIFFIYFGLSQALGGLITPFTGALLALGINSGAYQAEIIRGGIQSIPRGQMEAARSSGMSYLQAMRYVILPQGFRLIIPSMTNEYVTVIKDSSLAYAIGFMEITYFATRLQAVYFDAFVIFGFAALMYFTLTTFTSSILRAVEKKYAIPGYMGSD
jgi:polar amino acid transport system permease protein